MAEAWWSYQVNLHDKHDFSLCVFSRKCVAIVNVGNFNVRNFLRIIIVVLNTFDLVLLSVRFLNYRYEQQSDQFRVNRVSRNQKQEESQKIITMNWKFAISIDDYLRRNQVSSLSLTLVHDKYHTYTLTSSKSKSTHEMYKIVSFLGNHSLNRHHVREIEIYAQIEIITVEIKFYGSQFAVAE